MRRRVRPVWAAPLVLVAACVQLSSDPTEVVGITFDVLPWPSVVAGDTLRDATGTATPLTARFFDGAGDVVSDVPTDFISRDATVSITDTHYVIGGTESTGSARLVATGAGLQSVEQKVEVVAQPDSVELSGSITPLDWSVIDTPAANTSAALQVKVLHDDATNGATAVRSWIVTWHLEYRDQVVAPADTSEVFLVTDAGVKSSADTSDTQGLVSRRVRVKVSAGNTPADSVVVVAEAAYAGTPLRGSPLRLVLPLRPKAAADSVVSARVR